MWPIDLTDKLDIDLSPFKGPFKGKGANRRAMEVLENDKKLLVRQMYKLIREVEDVFPPPGPRAPIKFPHLRIFKATNGKIPQLWWRDPVGNSKYLKLFESDRGIELMSNFQSRTVDCFKEFDSRRGTLNFQSTLVCATLMRYEIYLTNIEALENREVVFKPQVIPSSIDDHKQ